ncbi:MAG: serine/threonine-protein phosphatase [Chloroflexi bacterium]|nr:serine/threonine-protein phosphatase [Chloroflexota bacterium]
MAETTLNATLGLGALCALGLVGLLLLAVIGLNRWARRAAVPPHPLVVEPAPAVPVQPGASAAAPVTADPAATDRAAGPPQPWQVGYRSVPGLSRDDNADHFGLAQPAPGRGALYLVADGQDSVSGSQLAVETALFAYYADAQTDLPASLIRAVAAANGAVYDRSRPDPAGPDRSTTLVAAVLLDQSLWLAYVGCSRAYLVRRDHITILTTDQAANSRRLGLHATADIATGQQSLTSGDILVLCTAGLYEALDDRVIQHTVRAVRRPQEAADRLVAAAQAAGGTADITVLVVMAENE